MQSNRLYDVILVGAGPSGSVAAARCAKAGLDTLLIERFHLRRTKCCAGGVLARAERALGFRLPDDVVEREITGFALVTSEGRHFPTMNGRLGVTVRRENLDSFLALKAVQAGAELKEGAEVREVKEGGVIEFSTSDGILKSRFAILAEGAGGKISNVLVGPHPKAWTINGLAREVSVEADPPSILEMHLLSFGLASSSSGRFPLSGASFPRKRSVVLSAVADDKPRAAISEGIEKMQEDVVSRYGGGGVEWECTHPLPIIPRRRLNTNRVAVVGDAAGLVSPFSGEGLTAAIQSGNLAADAVISQIGASNPDLKAYGEACQRDILPRLQMANAVGPWLHWLSARIGLSKMMRALEEDEELSAAVRDFVTGEIDAKRLARIALPHVPSFLRPRSL